MLPKWVWSGSREQFLHCGLRKFRHSKSSVYRWYTQLDRRRFVYDTWGNGSRLGRVMVECTLSITHCLRLNLQLHTIDLVVWVVSALLRGNWQDFNWHDASRGPSAIAELLVDMEASFHLSYSVLKGNFGTSEIRVLAYWILSQTRILKFRRGKSLVLWTKLIDCRCCWPQWWRSTRHGSTYCSSSTVIP